MMQMSQVNFTGEQRRKRSFLGDVAGSVVNVGATIGAGAAVGGLGGKVASLVPYKIKDADMAFQYGDMFYKATGSETTPDLFKSATGTVKDLIEQGKTCLTARKGYQEEAEKAAGFLSGVLKTADDTFNSTEVQGKIQSFFHDAADKVPSGGYTKEAVKTRLEEGINHAVNAHKGYTDYFCELQEKFIEAAKATGNENWDEIAKKGAKALRNRTVIGAGIAIGVVTALVLNIAKSFKGARAAVSKQNKNDIHLGTSQG